MLPTASFLIMLFRYQGDQRNDTICTLGLVKLKEQFQAIEQRLQSDDQKDVIRKILLNLSSHEQHTQRSQCDTFSDTLNNEMSNMSIPCVQADESSVDIGNAFE